MQQKWLKVQFINYSIEEFIETNIEFNPALGHISKQYSVLILPYCNAGDLEKYIEHKILLSEDNAKPIIYQILMAVEFCHQHNIIHRDLKLQNILLNTLDSTLYAYLCDFGISKQTEFSTQSVLGTYSYMAPEIFEALFINRVSIGYDKRVDIWSFGIMVYKILIGSLPLNYIDDFRAFLDHKTIKVDESRGLSLCALSFIECCLQIDPNRRKSASYLLEHEFMTCSHIPWYYFKWVEDEGKNQKIDSSAYNSTISMQNRKLESNVFMSDVLLSSFSLYLENE